MEGPYLDAIISDQNSPWLSDIDVNGKLLRFKLDTGVDVSAISELTYKNLQRTGQLTQSSKSLLGPSGQSLPLLGQLNGKISHGNKVVEQPIYVVKGLRRNLLGLHAITALGLVVRVDTISLDVSQVQNAIFKQFPSVYSGLGKLGNEYSIRLKPNDNPMPSSQHRMYHPHLERK
jgi:hypothetical protein